MFAFPAELIVTLALASTLTLLLPFCIAVASIPVNWLPLPIKKLPVTLPVADTTPAVTKFPPVMLPVATINPAVPKLPTLALPVTDNVPAVDMLAPVKLPVDTTALPLPVNLALPKYIELLDR